MPIPNTPNFRFDALPDMTREVLSRIIHFPELDGFRLVGGTALALQVAHRQSEDIDLCWMERKLPRSRITSVIQALERMGYKPVLAAYETTRLYWENDGTDLDDFQQDWMVDGVKLSFAVSIGDSAPESEDVPLDHLRVVAAETIFQLKARLLVARSTIRDLYDIWWFLTHGGHSIMQVVKIMQDSNPHYSDGMIRRRLLPPKVAMADPGVHPLLEDAPADFEALKAALSPHVAEWERQLARTVITEQL